METRNSESQAVRPYSDRNATPSLWKGRTRQRSGMAIALCGWMRLSSRPRRSKAPTLPAGGYLRVRFVGVVAILLVTLSCATTFAAAPHPFHTSMAEMEYNPETKRLEVALRLYIVDCETVLTKLNGKPVQIGDEANRDKLLQKYLETRFRIEPTAVVKPKVGKKSKPSKSTINFVGSEIDKAYVWAYFELTPPAKSKEFSLRNDVFVEVQPEQTNVVQFRHPNGRKLHSFDGRNRVQELSLAKTQTKRSAAKWR